MGWSRFDSLQIFVSFMCPKGRHPSPAELFQQPSAELISLEHPLVKLAALIDWSVFMQLCCQRLTAVSDGSHTLGRCSEGPLDFLSLKSGSG